MWRPGGKGFMQLTLKFWEKGFDVFVNISSLWFVKLDVDGGVL